MIKKKHNYLLTIILIMFVIYFGLYIAQRNGYYDYLNYNKKVLTEEAMKKFEEDVKNGINVNTEDYLINTYKDYSNGMSKIGLKVSESTSKLMQKGISKTFGLLNSFFTE